MSKAENGSNEQRSELLQDVQGANRILIKSPDDNMPARSLTNGQERLWW